MVQIKWLIEARDDLREIFNYISKDSERYAERQIDRILERTFVLRDQIKSGKIVDELSNDDVRELIEGRYRII